VRLLARCWLCKDVDCLGASWCACMCHALCDAAFREPDGFMVKRGRAAKVRPGASSNTRGVP
jgi:hypothetical protein